MRRNHRLLLLLLMTLSHNSCAVTSSENFPPSPIINISKFDLNDVPICSCRVFKVADSNFDKAERFLGKNAHLLINPIQIQALFPQKKFDVQKILQQEIKEAEIYAREREEVSKKQSNSESFLRIAKTFRSYANYTKTLKPPLFPYLVKVKVYVNRTGAFSVSLKKNTLDIFHGSLGEGDISSHYVYLVIFVEREIDSVVVDAGYSS